MSPSRPRTRPARVPAEPARPRPPASLDPAVLPDHDLDTEAGYERLGFVDLDLSGRRAEAVEFTQCRMRHTTLAGTTLSRARLTDCLVESGDWANLRMPSATLLRVRAADSRMTGFALVDAVARDVVFEACRMDLSGWRFTRFTAVRFEGCNLTGADFTGADLGGAAFVGCDLTGARFDNATMTGTRFRDCVLLDVAGVTSWRGAVVEAADLIQLAHVFAAALGVRIAPEP
ncbi:pentapeptide repeat-containing protein [Polymorphospora sp. NPDC051019]|uniref:pentapeptide repeat-containing protein n=1 Tax=Polymorphospora sp. NPDC051019 TaxID=3155725 RepID=UPI00344838D0